MCNPVYFFWSVTGSANEQRVLREVFAERRHVLSNANIANEDNQEALQPPTTPAPGAAQNAFNQQNQVAVMVNKEPNSVNFSMYRLLHLARHGCVYGYRPKPLSFI